MVVRPIASSWELQDVYHLTHDVHVARGYCEFQPDGRLIHRPEFDNAPETTVFVALAGAETVGTISLTLDGPGGLPVEGLRAAAVAWRLIAEDAETTEALIRAVLDKIRSSGAASCVFAVDPEHEQLCLRRFNMRAIAGERSQDGAPVVLLRAECRALSGRHQKVTAAC